MPELPEVETVCNALKPHLVGAKIINIQVLNPALRNPVNLLEHPEIIDKKITALHRRAKYMIARIGKKHSLLIHLGMTGSFRIQDSQQPSLKHDHVILRLNKNRYCIYNDPRRFGQFEYHEIQMGKNTPDCLDHLGPEPFSDAFSDAYFSAACKNKVKPIKNLIMDNTVVVGVGNIYASEALFACAIHPERPAGKISKTKLNTLRSAIINTLEEAIKAGGSTIINFKSLDGSEGYFARQLMVYDRKGETCKRCKRGRIRQVQQAGRSSFFCPVCQRH
ncbi:MAG: bifunctional DNA-formamidopyrimidine glycosylase/DNA-(apurinic or apyrimidinic site) lyase [Lentisphaeria bacterium]|nr:bifunctional DNA-formamidopyrimidine glycosylase/DNA-(apurinic or apyrimidinic site) lyase [Lentisphaeria bacterium]